MKGVRQHDRGEMLSLTDMWKAGGSDPQQAPAKWRALPATKSFVEHVEVTIGKSDSELFKVQNGGKSPGTFAHWQIALAHGHSGSGDFCASDWRAMVARQWKGQILGMPKMTICGFTADGYL